MDVLTAGTNSLFVVGVLITQIYLPPIKGIDNGGRKFILAFPENRELAERPIARVIICSRSAVTIDVTIDVPLVYDFDPVAYKLEPEKSVSHDFNMQYHLAGTGIDNKGILIETTGDVVIQAANINDLSTDSFLVLPTQALGIEYYVMSYVFTEQSVFHQGPSQFVVVATEDDVTVQIVTSTELKQVQDATSTGKNLNVKLRWCETFQLQSSDDLTGTRILANKPIAVLSGSVWTSVGEEHMGDHLVEMMIPTQAWGKEFLAAPIVTRQAGDIFRILASQVNTSVSVEYTDANSTSQSQLVSLTRGSYIDVDTGAFNGTPVYVRSTKPILVAQFCKSNAADGVRYSDPFMMLIPPTSQFSAVLVTSTFSSLLGKTYANYLAVVIPTSARDALTLDGVPLSGDVIEAEWPDVLATSYATLVLRLPDVDRPLTLTSGSGFGAVQYGLKFQESYGMLAGQRLNPVPGMCVVTATRWRDLVDNDCDQVADEEIDNGLDDDGDSLIDEDVWDDQTARPTAVDVLEPTFKSRQPAATTPRQTVAVSTAPPTSLPSPSPATTNVPTSPTQPPASTVARSRLVDVSTAVGMTSDGLQHTTRPSTVDKIGTTRLSSVVADKTTKPEKDGATEPKTTPHPTLVVTPRTTNARRSTHADLSSPDVTKTRTSAADDNSKNTVDEDPTGEESTEPTASSTTIDGSTVVTTSIRADTERSTPTTSSTTNFFLDNLGYILVPACILVGVPLLCLLYFATGAVLESIRERRVVHPTTRPQQARKPTGAGKIQNKRKQSQLAKSARGRRNK